MEEPSWEKLDSYRKLRGNPLTEITAWNIRQKIARGACTFSCETHITALLRRNHVHGRRIIPCSAVAILFSRCDRHTLANLYRKFKSRTCHLARWKRNSQVRFVNSDVRNREAFRSLAGSNGSRSSSPFLFALSAKNTLRSE